jgi:hypothetical protein
MKISILALAIGVALACPTTAYANENRNIFEELFFGSPSVTEPMRRQSVSNRATRSYPAGLMD